MDSSGSLGFSSLASEGSSAIPVLGSILKLGMGLLAAHDLRYKDALNENAAVVQATAVFDNDLKSIIAALNAGTVSEQEGIGYLQQTSQHFWAYVGQYAGKPGVAAQPCGPQTGGPVGHGACGQGPTCGKLCTAGCCVGCKSIQAAISNAIAVVQAGGGTFNVCTIYPSPDQYKNPGRPGYTLTYTPPGVLDTTEGAVSGFLSSLGFGNIAGSPGAPSGSVGLSSGPTIQKFATYGLLIIAGLFVAKKVL